MHQKGRTGGLHCKASGEGHVEIVKEVHSASVNINALDKTGETALRIALHRGHQQIVAAIRHEQYLRHRMTILCLCRMGLPLELGLNIWELV